MGFVNSEEADVETGEPVKTLKKTLWRSIEQFQFAVDCGLHHTAVIGFVLIGVEGRGGDAVGHKSRRLVLHEGYQRRYNNRHTMLGKQCRHLKAQRLATARRQQHYRVTARHHRFDDLVLARAERTVTVETAKQAQSPFVQLCAHSIPLGINRVPSKIKVISPADARRTIMSSASETEIWSASAACRSFIATPPLYRAASS